MSRRKDNEPRIGCCGRVVLDGKNAKILTFSFIFHLDLFAGWHLGKAHQSVVLSELFPL
jgi:hypothetical protein